MPLDHKSEAIQWHAVPLETVISNLQTDTSFGLTVNEARDRLARSGKNELPRGRPTYWWEILFRQFKNPLVYILLMAAVFTIWLKEWVDTTVILLSVAVNTLIGFYQEYQANNLLAKLKKVVRIQALVVRDGQTRPIDAAELVTGDIIELKTGSKIPADARLMEAHHLATGEAVLTGESTPVKKNIASLAVDTALGDRANMVWMGTVVEQGAARAVAVATGAATEIGRIAALSMEAQNEETPLQGRLRKLANVISVVVAASAAIIFVVGLYKELSVAEVFTTAVAVAVSAIPEGLVAALSVVLAVATARILEKQGLVRRPLAAETLGSTTVICTDKTGTLTEGIMKVEKLLPFGPVEEIWPILAMANEAVLVTNEGKITIHGEATDRAKLEYALANGFDPAAYMRQSPRSALLPFDSVTKYLASWHINPEAKQWRCLVSGAPEVLMSMSTRSGDGEVFDETKKEKIRHTQEELAAVGYRLIALAERILSVAPPNDDDEKALRATVNDLTFRGLVAIRDPIRADVKETVRLTRQAGVRLIMVTGDHRLTAAAIGRELGFRTGDNNIVDGQFLDQCSDKDLTRHIHDIDICVRVNPEHKLRIVKALLANGEAVAMTGDGINDAPALQTADIGVAVGSATDVTKEAADLVLLNDGLTTIVSAIREGRVAFDNIKKVTVLLLSGSFTAFLMVMASLVLGLPLPMSPVQILWANLVENGLPNFALAFEPGEADVMERPPVQRQAPILDAAGKWIVFGVALMRDCLLIGVFLWFYRYAGYELAHVRTIAFALLSTDSLFYIFSIKSFHQPLWREDFFDNWFLLGSIGLGAVMVVAAIYLSALNWFLGTVRLSVFDMAVVVGVAALDVVLIEIVKAFYRRHIDTPITVTIS